jgi:hypothetical protein
MKSTSLINPGTPKHVAQGVPLSDSADLPVWTSRSSDIHHERGQGYTTYNEVRRRGWRYHPGDNSPIRETGEIFNNNQQQKQSMLTDINPASKKKIHVRVLRAEDEVETVLTYRAFDNVRDTLSDLPDMRGTKRFKLLGQCDQDGNTINGNPDLSDEDRQSISK